MVIKLLLVALVAACLGASAAAAALLLAVGAVSSTSARVLVDGADSGLLVRVLRASDGALQAEKRLQERAPGVNRPRALELDGLAPSTRYTVEILDGEAEGEVVWLRTAPERAEQAKVLVVSCDRFVDDEDDELWRWFAREAEHSPSYFGVAHIGDQVYVDAGDARVPVAPLPLEQTRDEEAVRARYDALVDAFRGIYRATFGRPVMQRVLRRGAHWMLPDDHEVLNNVNRERVERAFKGWTDEARSDDERALLFELTLHHRAGMQVFYEFQYQLQRDVPWDRIDFLLQPLDEIIRDLPLHFSVDVGALKLFFLDARYDRAFLPETGASELIGDTQSAALTTELQRWQVERERTNSPVTAVVLANLPLFFHSSLSAAIAYMVEKESYPGLADHRISLEKLLATLINPNQSVVRLVVGGDVHMMAHSQICRSSQDFHCVDQLITSGVTNGSTAIEDVKLIPFYYLITRLTPLVDFLFDTTLSIFPETVQNNLNAALGRAPWRTSYDRVFLGRNYGVLVIGDDGGFDWKQTVVAAHGRTSQHLVQTFFDLTASFWFHGAILTFFVAANIVATRRATRWLCTSKRPSVHKAKQQ